MTTKLRLLGDRGVMVAAPTWSRGLRDYLANKAESTRKTYQADWDDLVRCSDWPDLASMLDEVFDGDDALLRVRIPAMFLAYQSDLLTRPVWNRVADREAGKPPVRSGLAISTVARRLNGFRALVRIARMAGRCPDVLLPDSPSVEAFRDTRGIGRAAWNLVIERIEDAAANAKEGSQAKGLAVRDLAILRLLHDCGLRRVEVVRLKRSDLSDDLQSMSVWGKGKDKSRKKQVPLASRPGAAVASWLTFRSPYPGALFTKTTDSSEELTRSAVNKLVGRWGVAAGLPRLAPHQLRHTAITTLAMRGATLMEIQAFARHANPQTTQIYIDNLGQGVRKSQELLGDDDE